MALEKESSPTGGDAREHLVAPSWGGGVPASGRLGFEAFRNGSFLGRHELSFCMRGSNLVVAVAVDYAVKFGPLTFFKYKLRGQEIWSGGVLVSARMQTNNNGAREFMSADLDGDALFVEGSKARGARAPKGSLLTTHWNIAQLDGPMINPQDGSLLRFSVKALGDSKIADASGRTHMARRYALRGENSLDLWYDDTSVWKCLRAKAVDGSLIAYSAATG